jgi:hypothetical protein
MLRRVDLLRTNASEERIASIVRVTRIYELETMLAVPSSYRHSYLSDSCHPDDGGGRFLRSVGSYQIPKT